MSGHTCLTMCIYETKPVCARESVHIHALCVCMNGHRSVHLCVCSCARVCFSTCDIMSSGVVQMCFGYICMIIYVYVCV